MTVRVLLSGGMDSTLCLVMAVREHGKGAVEAVGVDYGQRHRKELAQASLIARVLGVKFHVHRGLSLGASNLTGAGELDSRSAVVPDRNKAMLRAAGWIGSDRAEEVWIGATAGDYEVFEDCRRSYFDALEEKWHIAIRSPLVDKTKADIVGLFHEYGASSLLVYTWSCYAGGDVACGHCGACSARIRGFHAAGVKDPGAYADRRLLSPCPRCMVGGEPTPPGMRCHGSGGWSDSHRERPVG